MTTRKLSLCLLLVTWAADPSFASGPRIIAGKMLDQTWEALKSGYLRIENPDLKNEIRNNLLTAIYLPDLKEEPYEIVVCRRATTQAQKRTLTREDYQRLRSFAENKLLRYLLSVNLSYTMVSDPQRDAKVKQLTILIDKQPDRRREVAKRFAGALLCDVNPKDQKLNRYVMAYRAHVLETAKSELTRGVGAQEDGKLLFFGKGAVELRKLAWIDKSTIKMFEIGGKSYKTAWNGSSLMVVPQLAEIPSGKIDPVGLGASELFVTTDALRIELIKNLVRERVRAIEK